MHAVSTNQITVVLHFNNNEHYLAMREQRMVYNGPVMEILFIFNY